MKQWVINNFKKVIMINSFIIGVTSLFSVDSANIKENINTPNEEVCRVTCTINVSDGFGGTIGISGTAGNIFTSCETAREEACKRALQNVIDIMYDM